jgi:hypothetical protein
MRVCRRVQVGSLTKMAMESKSHTLFAPRILGTTARILKIPSEGRAETPCDLRGKRLRTRGERRKDVGGRERLS